MSKLFRGLGVFAGRVAVVFVLSQIAFAGGVAVQTKQREKYTLKIATSTAHILSSAPTLTPTATAGQLLISEFRLFGVNGTNDEFIEIFNNSGANHTVVASGTGTGYAVAASDGIVRCTIPNGVTIPNKGHFLCANSVAYSLASYPAGNGTTATADATYTLDIATNTGIALFTTNVPADFSIATRLDAVGSVSETNTLYKEGTGYGNLTQFFTEHSLYRDNSGGPVIDTDNNANDLVFVDTQGVALGHGQRLGAPGPENLNAPIERNAGFTITLLDFCATPSSPPNRVRDFTSDPANNSTFGTLEMRRTVVNNTGAAVTRLRFRIVNITTFPAPINTADLRARTSSDVTVTVNGPPCSTPSNVAVRGTLLEESFFGQQPHGGAFNSSLSVSAITLAAPLANGASVNVRFLLGVEQIGNLRFFINIEALP